MKDIFNRRQRFSLRKYSIGVCSVLLGTALFAAGAQSASADEATAASESAGTAASEAAQPATTESSQAEAPVASKAYGEGGSVPKIDLSGTAAATSETPASAIEKAEATATLAATENKVAPAETKKTEEASKPLNVGSLPEIVLPTAKMAETSSKPASTTVPTTAQPTATRAAAGESSERAAAREEVATPAGTTTFSATVSPAGPITGTEASAQAETAASTNAGALAVSNRRRNRRATADHNSEPVAVATFLKDGEVATPDMTDPNGASVRSQTVPSGYAAKEGDVYTYSIVDLTRFNERYHTNYYTRAYKRFDASTDTTVELIDKNTGNVVETRKITASSGIQKFTTTATASRGELTWQVDYDPGTGAGPGKTDQPFIQLGYEVGASIQALVAPGHKLTPDEKKLYDDVYAARTSTDIINVVEPAYNGRTITDTNAKIPASVNKTTYYKVVDKNNPTFNANKTDKTVQDYVANGNEVDLASYTLKAMEGQNFTASGERQFDGYKLYQAADANDQSGYVSRPYTVGTKFMDAERAGIKRIKEIVGEDGTVVVRVYLLDPKQQSKRSDGTLSTDGYMLLAETKPIKPGDYNKQELAVKKSPLHTIAFTDSKGVTYANGKEVPFDFQKAAGYTPYKTVFVPFLGDNIGHLSPNEQLVRGVNGIGTNVDLLNSLTPYKQPVYYYVKQEPVTVTPEVEKQLEGRVLVDGEFSFKIKEVNENKSLPSHEETVTNKNGKATFSKLSFNKVGTYTYTITEVKGADTNVDYDGMTVKMTVTVTENSKGDLQASVKYSGTGGFASSADDKVFNNYVVAPVKTKFDFSKALAGRELKAGEFSFVLKDSDGKVIQTKTNTKAGVVAFDDLTFDNTQVGTHKYTVEEVIPENKETGMTYDTMKAEVTITVTKQGHVLKATNTLPSDTEFNNTFTPVATQAQFKFTKKLEGKELTKDAFTFELVENGNVIQTKKNAADGTIQFDAISYDKEGSHTYTVREVAGTDTNIDYDDMNAVVKVNVTKDAASGVLTAKVTMPEDTEFNNFAVAPVKTRFDFSKALAGRELKEGEFSFVLKDSNGKTLQTKTNTKQGVVAFDDLTFDNTQVGTHKYTVEEVIPENKETGMTYDPMKAEVTITVTKEGHVLKATNTLPTDTEFNNTFTPAAAQAQFKFTKRLEGKELTKDAFTFELLENGNVIQTKKNAADGSITFDAIEYNAVGKHTYTVREKAGTDTNIDYDSMNAVVTVNVTKNAATGLLSAAVTMPEDTEFNNYVVSPVVTKFDFTKKLAGRKLAAGEFSFVLKDAAGNKVETVKNDADGNVTFSELSFDNTKVGTHTYTVEEVIPANKEFGMTYDQMKATVTVEVAKNGHSLTTVTNVTSTGGKDANGNATDGTPDKEFNNKVTPPETPKFQPEKFVVSKEKYDITGNKLMDDDDELTNEYTETNADPYVDKTTNNEPENLNTKTVKRGSKLVYQVWLDTTKFTEANNIQYVGVSDTYDADKLDVNAADIKAYDSVTGAEVTNKFDIKVENGTITATSKDEFIKDKVNAPVIDTTKFEFGRYYKFDIPATVKESVKAGADIENTANQTVHVYNPVSKTVEKPEKPTQKRVNSVPVPVEMNFTKRLEGRELQKNEFEFVLKKDGVEVERVKNDAAGKIVFKTLEFGRDDLGKTYNYTVEETPGTDATVKYDTMVATVKVVVSHDGTAKAIVANVTDAADKEFNNRVTPPEEPKFQPEKYVVSKEKYDITGDKLVDDDRELADKYADTNANPYADDASNNEAENLNTKTVERGSKLVYQVWLDTTKFDAANKDNIQTVGISDNYDEAKLNLNKADIKAYDSVTGAEVTDKFDIAVNNGVITANLKAGFTKSLGDAENTQVIDTTKFAFGRYYKFDIPTTVKDDVVAGADIENTAAQVVNYYNPTTKKVEKPEKPTEKRVNNVPISVEFNFTKKLEGRELKANEFTFELKDSDNVVIATATNDASGNFKFTPVDYTNKAGKTVTALKYQKGQEGTYTYTVTEVKGTDSTVTYDTMAAVVTVKVSHDGTAKALITNVTEPADKEFNNRVTPPTEPKFQPEKYVVSKAKFDITGTKLVDDDSELTDKYGETNTNPYVDTTANNEDENLNTKTVERGQKLYYQVWLDTTKFDANNKDNIQTVGITDNYDKDKLTVTASDIKVYDSVTGADVTTKFDISDNNGVLTANLKAGFTKSLGDAENTQIIDTTKFEFGRYYKFDIPATVKDDVVAGADIENKAAQVVNYYNPVSKTVEKPNKPTEKRVNSVPISVEFNFTKKLEGRDLKAGEFTFELKDSDNVVIATATNDKAGKIKFAPVEYTNKAGKTVTALKYQKGQEGTYKYTVEEVKGSDATVTYDTMKAVVTVEVRHDGTAKALITNVTDPADKEFNNTVRPPEEPKFQPEKYVVSEEKFDITGDKLVDDDKELADKYADTNANPYADDASNNEKQNLNTKTVKRGDKLVYQVWLDTTKFDASNKDNIQSVGISDDYDETKLDLDSTKIKAYDSVTGAEVTDKFDIAVNNGVITATLKDGFTKSLGDAENTQVIDTTKFEFGRYYKFDIPTTVKTDVPGGVDIENTAAQVVNYYNPTTKKVEKPSKPTEKRVNNVPVEVEFNFTKRLEGRELKANEFSFVLKDSEGKTLETVKNDASGNVKFSALEFKKGQEGVHNYTVEEVKGSDATVTYDTMKANVTVTVSHDGTAKILVATVGKIADKEFNNRVTPPEEPKFNPEKYVVSEAKFDVTGTKLVDDDKELANKVADTNANPYADDASNNEAENLNTKTVKRGQKLYYQVWLDTTQFDAANKDNIQTVGITDDFDETKLTVNASDIKAYDSVSGADVTSKFDISIANGVITANLKDGFTKSLGDAENTQIIDTTKFEFGRYYKFDIPATVNADVPGGADIENTATQVVNYYNPTTKKVEKPEKPTEKRVNNVPVEVEFNFTKRLEGRELKANEFSFVLKDSEGKTLETVSNDAAGNVKFSALEFKKGQEGVHNYTVEEVKGSDATVTYDTMKANVTVTVKHDGTAKVLIATVGEIADKEFNNRVTPPEEPKFQPEKYVVSKEKYDITGDKLVDDDKELADKYADTNADPYADDASNNEKENLNTKTVKRGDKLVYQVWLDTTKFDANNKDNIQSVGISDDYDEAKLELDSTKIKAYDSVTGAEVTDKFDIAVNNGVITATLKDGFTKSLGDAENTQVIDTTKFEFGRYYKFDIPTTVKADVPGGVDIENTAAQVVNYYNPTTKKVEKPSKPTEKRVNNVPVEVEFNFTKRLEGRELKANEFSFVLKDSEGKTLETVKNDASGNVKFSALEFKKGQEGVHNYTVEEVKGSDATVTYDTMKANVTVTVSHDGTAKILVATVGKIADKEFNNKVTPPETPEFNPEKYVLNEKEFDLTGTSLLDDDKELADKYADTNANPYADDASNNEKANINTKSVKPGQKLVYQVWLDTTKFDANNKDHIQSVGISDDYDEAKVDVDGSAIKAYDGKTGADVTAKFDITVNNGVITATLKDGFTKSLGDAENTQVIDTTKFEFGRYYKFDIPATVKADVAGGVDIENTAAQVVNYYNPTTKKVEKPEKPTEKRVNSVPVEVEFNFTKRMEGRELKANEFSLVLKDSTGKEVETVKNDKDGNVKFSKLEFKKGQEGVHNYTVEEVKGSDATVTYDTMKANVTVTVSHDGKAKVLIAKVGDIADKEFNNKVTPPETPEFNPEKYILNAEKFDLTGKSLLDDDKELADKVAETNANPYADKADNNEAANINTKTVKRGDKVVYQVWLDTTKFTEAHNIQSVGVTDDYEEDKLDINVANIKAYDSVTGEDVTAKFDIKVENGVISATSKADLTKSLGDAENTPVIDTTKFAFGRYYKFDIPATVKDTVKGGADIENTAAQIVHQYDPTSKTVKKPNKPTEKRVVNIPVSVEFNFTKRLEGRDLKANEFSFVLKDKDGKTLETVKNDASGNVKFSALEFKKGQEGTYNYTVEEVKGTDTTVTYDTMKAVVTVKVSHDGTAKALLTKVTDPSDKEFNNTVRPPETPEFNPEKYILNESKFDLTGVKLLDDDKELKDKVADTNANPYVDKTDNNEAQNINTKTLKKGDKVYYQVWLDTTKFTEAHNIQSVGVTDKYDSANLTVNGADIKAYDSVTGEDVTAKFDIKVENGVITATSKADLTKSLGDAENTQVIDTTKLAFGRYYKFEIPAEIKQSAQDGVDIENTASQIVHQYNPTKKTVEKPEKPTEKRVVNIPVKVQFQFTKKLEGRALKAGEFSFVLKDEKGNVIETVTNDAAGKITFSNLEFKRGEEGTHLYHVEEIRGTDSSVEYDKMVATVGIMINKDGKVLTAITQLPEDTEFNNTVIPPTTPPNTPPTTPPNTPPTTPPNTPPNTPPTTPPNTPPTPPTTPPTPPTPPTPTTPPAPALPETGEEQSASAALLGAALGMVGLAGLAKRKKRED
ncbi:SspB-related isopeptide-forming adhesin [Streptococcus parasanguinis]|uniref:SspB-related isopeptide-forming adhesin n=3 Tax=Streptococcus parasanguinis TaxID=1318 RepID=UPI00189ECA2B|nr:SspB-related isopeptide-forming adhesin [Streptococcus parasanguinis]